MTIYTQLIVALFFLLMTGYLLYTYLNKKAVNERFIYFTLLYFILFYFILFLETKASEDNKLLFGFFIVGIVIIISIPSGILILGIINPVLSDNISIYKDYETILCFSLVYLVSAFQWFVIVPFIIKKNKR